MAEGGYQKYLKNCAGVKMQNLQKEKNQNALLFSLVRLGELPGSDPGNRKGDCLTETQGFRV
jgi:hypothetical protein